MDDYYNTIAPSYDELHGEEQRAKLQEFLHKIQLDDRMTLLDVGCGTGWTATMLDVHWFGVEPSKGLIAQAPVNVQSRIKCAPGEQLPFPDASFDVVLSLTALQNYDDPAQGVQELHRVCKPGGTILLSFLKKSPKRDMLTTLAHTLPVTDAWEQEKDLMYVCIKE